MVLAATATVVALQGGGVAGGACLSATPLRIVAAPAIAPAVQEIVQRDVDRSCVAAQVVPQDSADVASALAAGTGEPPALWIPDSSMWPKRARREAARLSGPPCTIEEHEPLAISPLVGVTARKDAEKLGWPDAQPGWQELIDGRVPTTIGDPATTTEGLATLLVVRRLLGNPDGTPRPELGATLLKVGRGAVPTIQAAYDKLGSSPDALVFTASEQSVVAHNRAAGRTSAVAVYPMDGTVALDYPVVRVKADEPSGPGDTTGAVTATDTASATATASGTATGTATGTAGEAATEAAAETVEAALRTPEAVRTLRAAGFRDRDGVLGDLRDGTSGIVPSKPTLLAMPPLEQATEVLRIWSAVTLDAKLLVLIDVSGSMDAEAGSGQTRIELARDAALTTLPLYPDSTDVGLWAFSLQRAPSHDWVELVPMGRMTDRVGQVSRRQALQEAFASLPSRTDGATGLNDTVLAAVRAQRGGYVAGRVNAVVVVTDGRHEDPDGTNDEALVRTLQAEADPARPVPVILVAMGLDVDFPALQRIAAATGGKAYQARDPADISSVFLD
ncbi:MAG TPA: substrate-binding domain-containing protein, partial [Pseudonocardiaceae bacterium]